MNQTERHEIDDKTISYLSIVQEPIGRLSTASSIFKGFAATIVTGISALSYADVSIVILILSFIPILAFAALDVYYLRLERRYRGLYNDILAGRHQVDFSTALPKDKDFIMRSRAAVWQCLKSPSIWLFYPAMLAILIVVCILKACGGI